MKMGIRIVLIVLMMAPAALAVEIGDVQIPDNLTIQNHTLVLNGAGFRKKWFVKVYVGGLYLLGKSQDQTKIIEADEPMAVTLHMVYDGVTSKKMTDSMSEGFKNATDGKLDTLKERIEQFNGFFSEEIKDKDIFQMIYLPGEGVRVLKNDQELGRIEGLDFKQALFGIWLCDKPADKGLKTKMLGQ
jgi:hypothetical protein